MSESQTIDSAVVIEPEVIPLSPLQLCIKQAFVMCALIAYACVMIAVVLLCGFAIVGVVTQATLPEGQLFVADSQSLYSQLNAGKVAITGKTDISSSEAIEVLQYPDIVASVGNNPPYTYMESNDEDNSYTTY